MSQAPSIELSNYGWKHTSQFPKFNPSEILDEFIRPSNVPTGRDLEPSIWQKASVDYSAQVETLVLRRFRQAIGREVDRIESFDINGRVGGYINNEKRGNGDVIAQISKQLYGNSARAREGSALKDLYTAFKAHDIESISLHDFIVALSEDYNAHKESSK